MLWSALIVQELIQHGITHFYISPGNRNAPIIGALAYHKRAFIQTTIDERASAYRALGYAKATGKPGVLVCTSGTAIANYYPALIEALRDEFPLIILSADRPPELIDSDANQTIQQMGIFGRYCEETLYLPCPSQSYPINALLVKIDHLIQSQSGPIHINCPFREPLHPGATDKVPISPEYLEIAAKVYHQEQPILKQAKTIAVPQHMTAIAALIQNAGRGLIVVGRLNPDEDGDVILQFAQKLGWPVFCDIASGLKGRLPQQQLFTLDHPKAIELLTIYAPQVIIQFGTGLVSKAYYQSILPLPHQQTILISPRKGYRDPSHEVSFRIRATAQDAIAALADDLRFNSQPPKREWRWLIDHFDRLHNAINGRTAADQLCFPIITQTIGSLIPEKEALFLGNSTVIRAFDMISPMITRLPKIITNRGVSGIEGNIATSIGFAEGAQKRVTVVIGDISFLHDLGSLMFIQQSPCPIILIVVNNHGGHIFDRLPIHDFPDISTPYMTTPHQLEFYHIARQFNLEYQKAETPTDLYSAYQHALQEWKPVLIEAMVDPQQDLQMFDLRQTAPLEIIYPNEIGIRSANLKIMPLNDSSME